MAAEPRIRTVHHARRFAAYPQAARSARSWARRICTPWRMPADRLAGVVQCASELAANAVAYGIGEWITMAVKQQGGHAHLTVSQLGGAFPGSAREPALPPLDQEHGRGLRLVDALSDEWGADDDGDYTRVWCRYIWPVEWEIAAYYPGTERTWARRALRMEGPIADVAHRARRDLRRTLTAQGYPSEMQDLLLTRLKVWQTDDGRHLRNPPDYDSTPADQDKRPAPNRRFT